MDVAACCLTLRHAAQTPTIGTKVGVLRRCGKLLTVGARWYWAGVRGMRGGRTGEGLGWSSHNSSKRAGPKKVYPNVANQLATWPKGNGENTTPFRKNMNSTVGNGLSPEAAFAGVG